MNNEKASAAQLLQVVAKFAQVLPINACKAEMQKVIEDNDDPLWAAIIARFTVVDSVAGILGSLKDMIAAGHYDWVNGSITEGSFPMPDGFALGLEPKVFHFNRKISSERAIEEMEESGYRPATIWDLLDYGAKNPEEQREFPIVALGSVAVVGGRRYVACLDRGGSARGLHLRRFGDGWTAGCRFLAVRI